MLLALVLIGSLDGDARIATKEDIINNITEDLH